MVNNVMLVILQMGTTNNTQQRSVNFVTAMNMEVSANVVTATVNVIVNSSSQVTNVPSVLLKIALAQIVTSVIAMALVHKIKHVIHQVLAAVKLASKESNVTSAMITTLVQTVRNVDVTLTVAKVRNVTKLTANVIAD